MRNAVFSIYFFIISIITLIVNDKESDGVALKN